MKIINKLLYFLKIKIKVIFFKHDLKLLRKRLRIYEEILIDKKIHDVAYLIKDSVKYENIYTTYQSLIIMISNHNKRIKDLTDSFLEIINNNDIEFIIKTIDDYSIEKLQEFNEVALEIGKYTIPNSFPHKKLFIQNIIAIGRLINEYDDIKEQFTLLKSFNDVSILGDRYIDDEEASNIIHYLRSTLDKLHVFQKRYYSIPILEEKFIERHNEEFIKNNINNELFDNINGKSLDIEQRKAILYDTKSNLTIAGAGAGKTLTICGKVKWLLEHQKVDINNILLLSYSRASAEDLDVKVSSIQEGLKVKTFHSLGLEILNKVKGVKNTIDDQFKAHINKYFEEELIKDKIAAFSVFQFYTLYLYDSFNEEKQYDDEGQLFEALKKQDYTTLKDKLAIHKDSIEKHETMKNEIVKSKEELIIANWLFMNGVKYQYEKSYEKETSTPNKRQYTPDFYLEDYNIYLEHYGINKEGRAPQYTEEQEQSYLSGMEWKRNIHSFYKTTCLETFSYEFADGTIFDKLKTILENNGVELKPLSEEEINEALNRIYIGQEFGSLFNLIITFISLYKAQYPDRTGFDELRKVVFSSVYEKLRTDAFLNICESVYDYYIKELHNQKKIDFDDMILQSIEALDITNEFRYKYIIVDEFQDISQSRNRFLEKLISHGNSKLFAVGDDWQAIYRFAGCDVNIFLKFGSLYKDTKINKITSTHRNSAELQEIVEPFITANPEQYKKHIRSEIHQEKPVRIIYHNKDRKQAFITAIKNIYKMNKNANVLVLGRNRHDVDCLISKKYILKDYDEIISLDYPTLQINYKTVHQSKGLECEYVILISGEDSKYGFPNKMEDDKLLQLVLSDKSNYPYAEERRLFYVALTRTKSIVYILSDKNSISTFVEEIEEYSSVENPEILKDRDENDAYCPACKSGILVLKTSGTTKESFFGCANYPYCNYTINDLKAVAKNNRCPVCNDFLVLRDGKYGRFLGCHNYPRCTQTKQLDNDQQYYKRSNTALYSKKYSKSKYEDFWNFYDIEE